jgi:putative DNA primase/helicase
LLESARDLTTRLGGNWHGRYGMACCPAHDDRNPSLQITPGRSTILLRCYAGCEVTDIFRALRSLKIDANSGASGTSKTASDYYSVTKECENARRRWRCGQNVRSTLAERYLRNRGIGDWGSYGRFLPSAVTFENEQKVSLPALILPLTVAGSVVAIQRIFLDPETGMKAAIASPKKILGVAGKASIRLGSIESGHLNLAEGFEDAGSAMKIHNLDNCWAVCGIERYALISIPDTIHSITVYSQHGVEAARALGNAMPHLSANNRSVQIVMPPPDQDWNDCLMAQRERRT